MAKGRKSCLNRAEHPSFQIATAGKQTAGIFSCMDLSLVLNIRFKGVLEFVVLSFEAVGMVEAKELHSIDPKSHSVTFLKNNLHAMHHFSQDPVV